MTFGLNIATTTIEKEMNVTLLSVKWQAALTYPDEIVVFFKSFENHPSYHRCVLTLLRDAGVAFKLKKCSLLQRDCQLSWSLHETYKTWDIVINNRRSLKTSRQYIPNGNTIFTWIVYHRKQIRLNLLAWGRTDKRKTAMTNQNGLRD